MYRRTAFVLVVVLLALIDPLKAQDTATISDRQLRQRIDYALGDTRKSIEELNQVLVRMQTLRTAVQNRITRDSLASRPSTSRPGTGTSTGGPNSPGTGSNGSATPPAAAAVFEDGFEGGAPAAGLNGYGWNGYRPAVGEGVAVSRDLARSGSSSLRFTYAGNADPCVDGSAEQRFTLGENLPEVWMEYYVYMPSGADGRGTRFAHRKPACPRESDPNGTVSNNKFFALWGPSYDVRAGSGGVKVAAEYRRTGKAGEGDSYLYGTWCTDTLLCSDWGHPGGLWDPAFTDALRGRWVQVRIHARVADSKAAANGMLQMWFDGALRVNMQNLDLAPEPGGARYFRNGYLFGWSNSGFDQATSIYVDDFRIFRSNPGW